MVDLTSQLYANKFNIYLTVQQWKINEIKWNKYQTLNIRKTRIKIVENNINIDLYYIILSFS